MSDSSKTSVGRCAGLRPIKPGEVRNPSGRNGKARLEEFREYLNEKAELSSGHTRRENVLLALYATAIDRRRRDHIAAVRIILAYDLGFPAQALEVDHSSRDGSMSPLGPLGTSEEMIRAAEALAKEVLGSERAEGAARADGSGAASGSTQERENGQSQLHRGNLCFR